ncbi:hypothetical protein BH09PAT2_BH09PAT2_01350 [soil metagenome]
MSSTTKPPLAQLESTLEEYFLHKAPYQLSPNMKEAIVKFAPWIVIIMTVFSLPIVFGALAWMTSFSATAYGMGDRSMYMIIPTVVLIISVIMDLLALPGLFNRTMPGWKYSFYGQILSILSSILSGNIVGALVGAVLGFYILFQIKSYYK